MVYQNTFLNMTPKREMQMIGPRQIGCKSRLSLCQHMYIRELDTSHLP
jgi:hypothetical protein